MTNEPIYLTAEQRDTLNAAEKILIDLLKHDGESLMFSLHRGWESMSTTYFSPNKVQHGSIWVDGERNLAAKVNRVLEIRAEEDANADALKAARIERLRNELAMLGEAA